MLGLLALGSGSGAQLSPSQFGRVGCSPALSRPLSSGEGAGGGHTDSINCTHSDPGSKTGINYLTEERAVQGGEEQIDTPPLPTLCCRGFCRGRGDEAEAEAWAQTWC